MNLLRTVASWPASQRWARLVVGLGPVVALLADGLAVRPVPAWIVVLVAILGASAAFAPDSSALTVADLAVLAWWSTGLTSDLPPGLLLAAAALAAAHAGAVVAGYGPALVPIDPYVALRWLLRGAALTGASVAVWVLALGLRGTAGPGLLWPTALGLLVVVAAAASTVLRDGRGRT